MSCGQFPEITKKNWMSQMSELKIIADVELVNVFDQPSVDISPEVWFKLAESIFNKLDQADGFVVLHNVDNLLYTSSALTFLLQNLTKPIVFTGRQFNAQKVDFKANIINAVQAASNEFSEVSLMFGNRLLRASQATRVQPETLNIFETPENSIIGRIDFSVRIFSKLVIHNKGKTKLAKELNNNLAIITISPLLNLKALTKQLADKDGVIVKSKNYANIPQDLMFMLQKVMADVPVIIWSRQLDYSSLTPSNMIVVNNMTWEMTEVKFAWVLSQTKNINKVKELMVKDFAGEIID